MKNKLSVNEAYAVLSLLAMKEIEYEYLTDTEQELKNRLNEFVKKDN